MQEVQSPATRRALRGAAALLAAVTLGLGGCAALNTVNAEVSTFGTWPTERKATTYAFDRLPSQQARGEQQLQIETEAARALEAAGFKLAEKPADADVMVQLGARVSRQDRSPWDDPFWAPAWGSRWSMTPWSRPGWRWTMVPVRPEFQREVAVLLRDRRSGEALYEARASNDGATEGGTMMLGALFSAALKDFPAVKGEPHNVSVVLP